MECKRLCPAQVQIWLVIRGVCCGAKRGRDESVRDSEVGGTGRGLVVDAASLMLLAAALWLVFCRLDLASFVA